MCKLGDKDKDYMERAMLCGERLNRQGFASAYNTRVCPGFINCSSQSRHVAARNNFKKSASRKKLAGQSIPLMPMEKRNIPAGNNRANRILNRRGNMSTHSKPMRVCEAVEYTTSLAA